MKKNFLGSISNENNNNNKHVKIFFLKKLLIYIFIYNLSF